jgi:hypothetical protein
MWKMTRGLSNLANVPKEDFHACTQLLGSATEVLAERVLPEHTTPRSVELDTRPAPLPPNIAVSINEPQPSYQQLSIIMYQI